MSQQAAAVERLLDKNEGILKLKPTYVRRLYVDGGRMLGNEPGSTFIPKQRMWVPERWIASTTLADNPHPIPGEGLSGITGSKLTLADALNNAGARMLGKKRYEAHGPEFRVLIKILDGKTPISFHYHANDEAVARLRRNFKGHRFGKDEAYYFLDRPKGQCPYTHVGLEPGTTLKELRQAIARGPDAALELSPFFLQRFEEGFFLPGGIVHRPGTALTLEIQEPSDVYALLDNYMDGKKLRPSEMHPGFKTIDDALKLVDMKASTEKDLIDKYRLVPKTATRGKLRGASEDWIFPLKVCKKFSGKRLRVNRRHETTEPAPYAVLVWKGSGKFGPHRTKAGDEFFVTHEAARQGIVVEANKNDPIEMFKCFAAPV